MTSQVCSYQGCYTLRFPCSSLTFFQLPNDEPRRTQWILNSGNKQLQNLKANQQRYFCEYHFNKNDIKPHFYRKLLYKYAVPVPYKSDNVRTTTSSTADGTDFKDLNELEEDVNVTEEAYISDCNQVNEISDVEYEDDLVESLDISSTDVALLDEETDEQCMIASIITEDYRIPAFQESKDNLATTTNSDANEEIAVIDTGPTISIDVDYLDTTPAETSSAIITSTASSTTSDIINEATTGIEYDAAVTTSLVMNNDHEVNNEPGTSDKSYESDKHFALSLVYYFQRLNEKKKAKAKIDILSYLVALELDNDA
ncbi:PREDICTED: uncharacterized protein LOC108364628 [Rhagoletis zephyria]|uniref:uncharacterized protein LOC108364628 n=1 Tax=Rhagoletis zephyria TaxID=28612 RepID=UPI0008112D07|nr:PREDICTED: uncharacterized protein LOC108364628 [Rhagoletis zephyria]